MNKKEFVERFAERAGVTKKDANDLVDALLNEITEAFCNGEEISFVGFGKFSVKNRAERMARNPKTGEQNIVIPAHKVPYFTAGKNLKELINK